MKMHRIRSLVIFLLLLGCNGIRTKDNLKKESVIVENKTLINDIWALTHILETPISEGIEKRPQLEFNSKEKTFTGTNGCNLIAGNLKQLTNTDVQFDAIRETKMACREMKLASTFLTLLHETNQYKITRLNLTLMDSNGKVLLLFKKID